MYPWPRPRLDTQRSARAGAGLGSRAVGSSADVPVKVVDRVTLPRDAAGAWVQRLRHEYQPLAEARGYALEGIWQTRAAVPAAVDVVVEWRLAGVREFFRSRAGSNDPATVAWWAATDALAHGRTRSVMGPRS